MGKQCWSQTVLESGSWGHSVLQTPALVTCNWYYGYMYKTIQVFRLQRIEENMMLQLLKLKGLEYCTICISGIANGIIR